MDLCFFTSLHSLRGKTTTRKRVGACKMGSFQAKRDEHLATQEGQWCPRSVVSIQVQAKRNSESQMNEKAVDPNKLWGGGDCVNK